MIKFGNRRDFLKWSASAAGTFALGCNRTAPKLSSQKADLVLLNGKIVIVDKSFSFSQAVAVKGDKILAVGSDKQIKSHIGPKTEVIELTGRCVVPGLIDAHGHLYKLGLLLRSMDVRGTTSFEQIAKMVADRAMQTKPGEWIIGRSWDQNDWAVKKMPTHELLSKAAPDHPVCLTRVDGHACIANKKAMELAGITKDTKEPSGGKILRDINGEPTGVFVDKAMGLVSGKIPKPSDEQIRKAIELASESCLAVGLTGMHDAGCGLDMVEHYKYLIGQGKLGIRINVMLSNLDYDRAEDYEAKNMFDDFNNHQLRAKSVKLMIDGALGSRGAAMFEDYSDMAGNRGLLTDSYENVLRVARDGLRCGFQLCVHAIGDRGNRIVLDAFEQALKENPKSDHRFRIEHAQTVSPEDIPRFKRLGVIPSMQPTHATSDMYWAGDRVGPERVKGSYAWRKFLESGCVIPCGSDFPVEKNNPMLGIYAAVTRQDEKGWPEGGWRPEERMTRQEVIRGFTIWAAQAAFQEDVLGSIEIGKLADMVVLSKDITSIEPKEILTTKADHTIVAGRVRYSRR